MTYAGGELELFRRAATWKAYFASHIAPFLGDEVLEVGAGLGATTAALARGAHKRWLCLEPDAALAAQIDPSREVKVGTTGDLAGEQFDSILYIDVLEHIAGDRDELARAARLLRGGGHLIVLAPAHPSLYSKFDEAIGHHRRYDAHSLADIMPPELERVVTRYLDSAGTFLSLGNRLLLRAALPTQRQIDFWDRFVIPISRLLDPLLRYRVGKSVLEVRRKR